MEMQSVSEFETHSGLCHARRVTLPSGSFPHSSQYHASSQRLKSRAMRQSKSSYLGYLLTMSIAVLAASNTQVLSSNTPRTYHDAIGGHQRHQASPVDELHNAVQGAVPGPGPTRSQAHDLTGGPVGDVNGLPGQDVAGGCLRARQGALGGPAAASHVGAKVTSSLRFVFRAWKCMEEKT